MGASSGSEGKHQTPLRDEIPTNRNAQVGRPGNTSSQLFPRPPPPRKIFACLPLSPSLFVASFSFVRPSTSCCRSPSLVNSATRTAIQHHEELPQLEIIVDNTHSHKHLLFFFTQSWLDVRRTDSPNNPLGIHSRTALLRHLMVNQDVSTLRTRLRAMHTRVAMAVVSR